MSFKGSVRQVVEMQTHAPLNQIAKFEERWYRSGKAHKWIKTFTMR